MRELIGPVPKSEQGFIRRMRIHQGWWRAFVLGEREGQYPKIPEQTICNTILNGDKTTIFFQRLSQRLFMKHLPIEKNRISVAFSAQHHLISSYLFNKGICSNLLRYF